MIGLPTVIQLTRQAISADQVINSVSSTQAGAVLLFLGTTREFTDGRQTKTLDYDCYQVMAERKLDELESTARQRWSLSDVAIVHRLGEVPLGDISVAIGVSSPHRNAAFEAGRWLIDTLKQEVPIWKCEHWSDGTTEWIHPTEA